MLNEEDFCILIVSRGRSENVLTHKFIQSDILCCPESEKLLYEQSLSGSGLSVITYPDSVEGLAQTRNWVVQNIPQKIIIMLDDDISGISGMVGRKKMRYRKLEARKILFSVSVCAEECGSRLFSINQANDVRKFHALHPFSFSGFTGTVIGVIGKSVKWDNALMCKVDHDCTLRELMLNRYVWIDNRFCFTCIRNKNLGGNATYRTKERSIEEANYLRRKWKSHIKISYKGRKGIEKTSIYVERTQKISL